MNPQGMDPHDAEMHLKPRARRLRAVGFTLAPNAAKQPHLSSTVAVSVPGFHFKFHGKMSWAYEAIGSALHGVIKGLVEKKVAAALLNITNNVLPGILDTLPTEVTIGGGKSKFGIGIKLEDFIEPPSGTAGVAKELSAGLSATIADVGPTRELECPSEEP